MFEMDMLSRQIKELVVKGSVKKNFTIRVHKWNHWIPTSVGTKSTFTTHMKKKEAVQFEPDIFDVMFQFLILKVANVLCVGSADDACGGWTSTSPPPKTVVISGDPLSCLSCRLSPSVFE